MTFGAGDALDGGAGTDTLNVTVGGTSAYQATSMSGIEEVVGTFTSAGTISLLGATGVTSVSSSGSTANAAFTNIGSTSVGLKMANTAQQAGFGFASSAVSGSTDSATLTLEAVQHATSNGTEVVTIAGVETLNIVSSGSANVIDTFTTAAATKYVVTGDVDLTVGAALGTTVATVDANAFTGALTVTLGAVADATVTGGSGKDALTVSAVTGTLSVAGGAGNDTITAATNLGATDSIDGGDGTDTLSTTAALAFALAAATPTTYVITNMEALTVSGFGANAGVDDAIDTGNIDTNISTVNLTDGNDDVASTLTMIAGAVTVNLNGNLGSASLTVVDTGTATTDSVTIANKMAATDAFNGQNLVSTGYETLNISTTGSSTATAQTIGTISVTADTGGTATVNISGSNSVTTGVITAATAISASGLTGLATLTMVTGQNNATSITGGANADVLFGAITTPKSQIIDGGAGGDEITAGGGNDTLIGGAGNDSITSGAGNDSITGGDGDDQITLGDNLTSADTIDGGAGTNTLVLGTASLEAIDSYSISTVATMNANISNISKLKVTNALAWTATSFDMARLDSINHITIAASWTAAEEITGMAANSTVVFSAAGNNTNDLTLTYGDATGSADVLNVTLTNNTDTTDFGDIAIADIETLNVVTAETTSAANTDYFIFDVLSTALTTLNITGTEQLDIDATAINATTINASGNTGKVKILGGSAAQTITGTATDDSIQGGGGIDTIIGGDGADTLSGGTGGDSITGGEGIDSITGGEGNDTIVLTETTAVADILMVDGLGLDSVIGFTAGTGGDVITISLTGIEANLPTLDMANMDDGASSVDTEGGFQELNGAEVAAADTSFFVIQGATFDSTGAVETALEAAGDFDLTVHATQTALNDGFIVVYSDGTDAYVALAKIVNDTAAAHFATGDLTVTNLVKLVGNPSIAVDEFVAGNFDFIA